MGIVVRIRFDISLLVYIAMVIHALLILLAYRRDVSHRPGPDRCFFMCLGFAAGYYATLALIWILVRPALCQ